MFIKRLITLAVALLLSACSAVSFTHATGARGQAVTNAEVQADNTVVLTYPNGSACIDTNPGASSTCKSGGP
jgi:ABC-type glycerol-3-phosphate transport system substrate-binding protein